MSTTSTATYANDDGGTYAYDPRVIVEGARVRAAVTVETRHPGEDDEVTVPAGASGTVLDYSTGFYQCVVRLDVPRDGGRDVWIAPDELTFTAPRYAFDADAARPVLSLIERRFTDNVEDALEAALTKEQRDLAEWIGLDGFDPAGDTEINGSVRSLIDLAFSAGWMEGPSVPYFEQTDDDGMCLVAFHVDGPDGFGSRVPLALDWMDTADLIERVEGDGPDLPFHTNTDAALDLLESLTALMNAVLARLDAYVAAQVAKQPDPYSDLLDAATTDYEREVLDELRRKAGLIVACPCGWDVGREQETCDGCGQPRPDAA